MKYGIAWEDDGRNGEIPARFGSIAEAEEYALNCEEIPYGVKKGRTGTYWVTDEDGEEVEPERDEPFDGFRTDAEADGDALASAGFGTSEDYGGDRDEGGFYGDDG